MSSKHFIDDPTHLVDTALHAITLTNPSLALDRANKIIYRKRSNRRNVSIISGGGSGHEPSFAGFVGDGLLTAAVAGTIFASPSAEQIRRAVLGRVPSGDGDDAGVLVTVMNYTGDVLNFGMGVEKAKAAGRRVEMVVVGDDVGVSRSQAGKVGRRGIAGTCLVHKISGALASTGASLEEVAGTARLVSENVVSIGSSLSHVHVPGRDAGKDTGDEEELGQGVVEIGMGIHNEPGSEKAKLQLPELVGKMLTHLLDQSDAERAFLPIESSDTVVLLVNNLGGTSVLELGGITAEVCAQLGRKYAIRPARVLSGTFMTSLNGLGFSVSLLRVRDTGLGAGRGMLELLDAPAEAVGWSAAIKSGTWESAAAKGTGGTDEDQEGKDLEDEGHVDSNLRIDYAQARRAVESGLERVIKAEPEITRYDTAVGDGDCGVGLKRGAEAVLNVFKTSQPTDDAIVLLQRVVAAVEGSMDGTSGALYAIFLNALCAGLLAQDPSASSQAQQKQPVATAAFAKALQDAMASLAKYTPAKVGDRTLVDALQPFVETLEQTNDVGKAAAAADEGAKKTKGMKASLGRTVYVGGEGFQEVPDPGAYGLAEFLKGLRDGLARPD